MEKDALINNSIVSIINSLNNVLRLWMDKSVYGIITDVGILIKLNVLH